MRSCPASLFRAAARLERSWSRARGGRPLGASSPPFASRRVEPRVPARRPAARARVHPCPAVATRLAVATRACPVECRAVRRAAQAGRRPLARRADRSCQSRSPPGPPGPRSRPPPARRSSVQTPVRRSGHCRSPARGSSGGRRGSGARGAASWSRPASDSHHGATSRPVSGPGVEPH